MLRASHGLGIQSSENTSANFFASWQLAFGRYNASEIWEVSLTQNLEPSLLCSNFRTLKRHRKALIWFFLKQLICVNLTVAILINTNSLAFFAAMIWYGSISLTRLKATEIKFSPRSRAKKILKFCKTTPILSCFRQSYLIFITICMKSIYFYLSRKIY